MEHVLGHYVHIHKAKMSLVYRIYNYKGLSFSRVELVCSKPLNILNLLTMAKRYLTSFNHIKQEQLYLQLSLLNTPNKYSVRCYVQYRPTGSAVFKHLCLP